MWKTATWERPEFRLDKNHINQFDQIAIFVQKTNDMDTCACALALAELIDYNDAKRAKGGKTIEIIGLHSDSKFLKETKKYTENKIDWSKKVLVVLSEINGLKQIHKKNVELLQNASEIIIIDHHYTEDDYDENEKLIELIAGHKVKLFEDPTETSACEILWRLIKNHNKAFPEDVWHLKRRVAELLFMGLYTDTGKLTVKALSATTFQNIKEFIEEGVDVPYTINKLNQKPTANFRLLVETMKDAEYKKKCVLISLDYRNVFRYLPRLLHRNENGSLKQKKMLTWIPRQVEQLTDAHTIVFVHYSLHEPFNSSRKFVYIILAKENPALEKVLKDCQFKQNRNRWSREMNLYDLGSLMDRYDEIFTS